MVVELFYLTVHFFHALFSKFNLFFGLLNILIILFSMLLFLFFLLNCHAFGLGSKEAAIDVGAVSGTRAAILDRGNVLDVVVVDLGSVLLEGEQWLDFVYVFYLLKLLLVAIDLLLEVLHSLGDTLSDLEVVGYLFHGGSGPRLDNGVLGEGLMGVFQFPDFLFFKFNFAHLPMVISQFFVIIVIRWLLVLLQLVDWFFLFGWVFFRCGFRLNMVECLDVLDLLWSEFEPLHLVKHLLRHRLGLSSNERLVGDLEVLGIVEATIVSRLSH